MAGYGNIDSVIVMGWNCSERLDRKSKLALFDSYLAMSFSNGIYQWQQSNITKMNTNSAWMKVADKHACQTAAD